MLPYVGRKVTGTHIQKPELVSSTRIIAEMPDYNRQGIPKEILIEVQQRARLNSATGRVSYSGLEPVTPFVELQPPLVPAQHVSTMLRHARNAVDPQGGPLEILFHLGWEAGSKKWRLELPLQTQGRAFVRPTNNDSGSSYARSLVDVHSHPGETASFSGGDDADETGFRLYGLLGNVRSERPLIRVRAGIYGNRWEIPAVWIFALPLNIVDCVAEVWEAARGT